MFKFLQVVWTGVLLIDNMECAIKLPSKEQISIWTDNDLNYIDPRGPHQVRILSRVLVHIMDLKQNTEGLTRQQVPIIYASHSATQ